MDELVSVIVPIYNVDKYLRKCIESILMQSWYNLEVILVNDGSTDDSPDICEEYRKKDSRIIVLNKKNGGLSDARNAGLDVCKGEYIFFLDSDDYIHPEVIHDLLWLAINNDADIVECGIRCINEDDDLDFKTIKHYSDIHIYDHDEAIMKMLDYKFKIMAWNKLYKAQLFAGIRFPINKLHEDEFTIPYIVDKCKKYVMTSDQYYVYVQRAGSIMNQKFDKKRLAIIEAHEQRIAYFDKRYENKFHWIMEYHFFVASMMMKVNMSDEYSGSYVQTLVKRLLRDLLSQKGDSKRKLKVLLYYLVPKHIMKLNEKRSK